MPLPRISIPLEIAGLIVSLLDENDEHHTQLLKNLSLVTPQFAAATRSRLFQTLVIHFDPRRPPLKELLLPIITKNRLILDAIQELHLIVDRSLYLLAPGGEVNDFLPVIQALKADSIQAVVLEAQGQGLHVAPELLDHIAACLRSLRRLQIRNFTFHAHQLQFIATLEALELIHAPVLGRSLERSGGRTEPMLSRIPKLRRIVARDVPIADKQESSWDDTSIIRLLVERYQFSNDKLEEFAGIFEDNDHSPWTLIDLNVFATSTMTTLSLRTDEWDALPIHGNLFDRLQSVHTLTLQHLIPPESSRPLNIFQGFDCFQPPSGVRYLTFALNGTAEAFHDVEEWIIEELHILDTTMESLLPRRWSHLKTIDFQILSQKRVEAPVPAQSLPRITNVYMPVVTQHGVRISGLKVIELSGSSLDWPYYNS